jgi:CBS domain-containing protein
MIDLTVLQAKRFGIFQCQTTTPLYDAAKIMMEEDISCLVVVDQAGYLAGVFTRTDLLRAGLSDKGWTTHHVMEFMSSHVITVSPNDHLSHVAQLLTENKIHRVVIVHNENGKLRPIGVISDADIVYHMSKEL